MVETKASEPTLQITNLSVIMDDNEDGTVHYAHYSMILTYNETLKLDEATLEPLAAGWIEERMLDHEIELAEVVTSGELKLEGKVIFDATDLTKDEMVSFEEQEETIQGVIFESKSGAMYQAVIIDDETKLRKIGK